MDRTERFYRIEQLLRSRAATPISALIDELEVSRATVCRDIEYLRDRLNVPIIWDRESRGYAIDQSDSSREELPGLWFSSAEAYALMTMYRLLSDIQPGLLDEHIGPLLSRIESLVEDAGFSLDSVAKRIKVIHQASRLPDQRLFPNISHALLSRTRLSIQHFVRERGETIVREVSPQRLVHYRGNWYLDSWCHLREALRSFSVDAIRGADILDVPAKEIDDDTLAKYLSAGYGIFSGAANSMAQLLFFPPHSRWVADERWHPEQELIRHDDGSIELRFPYSDDRELVMDILKYGDSCQVIAPVSLRDRVTRVLSDALSQYSESSVSSPETLTIAQ